jgi:hypothetical protein
VRGVASEYLLGAQPRYAEMLDPRAVEQLVADHLRGGGRGRLLLAILMLEIWLQSYVGGAAPAPAVRRPVVAA